MHRLQPGTHVFLTVPGEPTTVAGRRVELAASRGARGVSSASLIGYAGDYAGYTTPPRSTCISTTKGPTRPTAPTLQLLQDALFTLPPMP
ncbi:MAG: hypothetical protein IPI43_11355 [Sandaracinaceae bacterium]|nr:hypothetical protein [Sandaracinaceae bacterium]